MYKEICLEIMILENVVIYICSCYIALQEVGFCKIVIKNYNFITKNSTCPYFCMHCIGDHRKYAVDGKWAVIIVRDVWMQYEIK